MKDLNKNKVLMYHGIISDEDSIPEKREVGAEIYDVFVESFEEQMHWLKSSGFKVGKFDEANAQDSSNVLITFDDGEMNNFELAFPILTDLGYSAYFFIIAKRVGKPGYMGWEELRKLHESGMIVGSHGLSHEILTDLTSTQVEEELMASKKNLERNLNLKIEDLSIPRGFCNDNIVEMAYSLGYKNIFISDRPKTLTTNCISRVAVKDHWTLERFQQAVNGQVPIGEKVFDVCKNSAKKVLRGSGYNFLRSLLIKMKR